MAQPNSCGTHRKEVVTRNMVQKTARQLCAGGKPERRERAKQQTMEGRRARRREEEKGGKEAGRERER